MNDAVEGFLAPHTPEVRDLALRARSLVLEIMPHAIEQVRTGHNVIEYGAGKGMSEQICYIAPFKSHVNLGFFRATELPDPEGLLGGTGKVLRHVKLRKLEDVDAPALRTLLRAAVELHAPL